MKNNTKTKIIDQARVQFNEYGFGQVTLRMIANELSMSCGNLNYHFKKREDILELLYFEMVAVFDKRVENLVQAEISMEHLYREVRASMERMYHYRFFWTDIYNILRLNPLVKEHFQTVYQQRLEGCLFLFKAFQAQGLLSVEIYKGAYQRVAEQLIHFGNTWWYGTALYDQDLSQNIEIGVERYLMILYPYLTEKGKKEMSNVLP